ncbi:protein of unknown function [Streptantibioticus cattleyicolor NRRL 8057 = DSM 46488]|nr:protein of unknown function [Streptantibioticus cattleyicolor NRRL 8057 = DSM 46488]
MPARPRRPLHVCSIACVRTACHLCSTFEHQVKQVPRLCFAGIFAGFTYQFSSEGGAAPKKHEARGPLAGHAGVRRGRMACAVGICQSDNPLDNPTESALEVGNPGPRQGR